MTHEQIAAAISPTVRATIVWLANSTPKQFNDAFGDDGPYLWDKFTLHYDAKEGNFICYLDSNNLNRLIVAVLQAQKAGRL